MDVSHYVATLGRVSRVKNGWLIWAGSALSLGVGLFKSPFLVSLLVLAFLAHTLGYLFFPSKDEKEERDMQHSLIYISLWWLLAICGLGVG